MSGDKLDYIWGDFKVLWAVEGKITMKAENKWSFIKENFDSCPEYAPRAMLAPEERKETKIGVCDLISLLFFSFACYLSEKPPPGGRLLLFGEYTLGPPGVRSGSRLCAAASSCLSERKREKERKWGKEARKTCVFDQWGAESRKDGSGDQGFATKLREERLKETFEERGFCFQSVFKGARADSALRHS